MPKSIWFFGERLMQVNILVGKDGTMIKICEEKSVCLPSIEFHSVVKVIRTSPLHVLIGCKCAINQVMARVWSLCGWEQFRVVEEPENGVHPSGIEQVANRLRGLCSRYTTVIITTYSPHLLDFFTPAEVSLCSIAEDGQVSLHRLSESDVVKEQSKVFTLGEIWVAEGDEALMVGAKEKLSYEGNH